MSARVKPALSVSEARVALVQSSALAIDRSPLVLEPIIALADRWIANDEIQEFISDAADDNSREAITEAVKQAFMEGVTLGGAAIAAAVTPKRKSK